MGDSDYSDYDSDVRDDIDEDNATSELTPPLTFNYPFKMLHQFIVDGIIDTEPVYQRDVVWSDIKQSHLVDSITKNFYIPPVIFSRKPTVEQPQRRVVIDGKQRLTSIHRFMAGEIPHVDSKTGKKRWFRESPYRTRGQILTNQERIDFGSKTMVCVEYSGLNMAQEQEIFNRVQLGMALTTAEKMYSSLGPLADFVRKLIKDHDELFKIVDSKRKRTFQILVQAYITVQTSPEKLPSGTVMNKWLKEEKPNNQMKALMDGVFRVFTKMWEEYPKVFQEVQNKKTNLWEVKKLAPIEFVMICYLIATKDALPVKQLQAKVGEMRTRIRSQFIDIRSNQRLYDAMKGIIDSM